VSQPPYSHKFPDVVVAGLGETGPQPADGRSIAEMVLAAVQAALADAGLGYEDIDAVVTASVDLFDGLTASNIAVTEVVGAVMKPETRIAGDGLAAALHAACQIRAGAYDVVLVVAHAKPSMADFQDLSEWALDPIYLQPLGLDFLACAGLQASAMAAADPAAPERWAETAARRLNAADGLAEPSTAAQVLESALVATPLRAGMCAPLADGACAVLLRAGGPGPRITGLGHDLDAHLPGDRDPAAWPGLSRALARALKGSGSAVSDRVFDLAEPSCFYAHEEELFVGATGLGPDTEISPCGGLFGGAVPVAAGLTRLQAAAQRLRADPDCRRALVHGSWGPAGQGQVVAILEAAHD
jgi:acetyl-CoA C-acetyltransferase